MQYATIYRLPAPQHALDNTSFGAIGVPQSQVPRLAFSSTISTACRSIDHWGAKTLGGLLPPCIIGVIRKHEVDLRAMNNPRIFTILYYLNGNGATWFPLADGPEEAAAFATHGEALEYAANTPPVGHWS